MDDVFYHLLLIGVLLLAFAALLSTYSDIRKGPK